MFKYEALIEMNPEETKSLSQYIPYCKFYFKPKSEEKIEDYLCKKGTKPIEIDGSKIDNLKRDFPFLKGSFRKELNNKVLKGELFKYLKKNKSKETLKDFPLNWLKNETFEEIEVDKNKKIKMKSFSEKDIKIIKQISGIYENHDLQKLDDHISKLPKYSFIIWSKFELLAPYFSKDDDEFYIIQNPILKETNFKIPMVRGSSWKGALASAFKDLINEKNKKSEKRELIESFLRIFGAGSESIRAIEKYLRKESNDLESLKDKLLEFVLFELGLKVNKTSADKINSANSESDILAEIQKHLSEKRKQSLAKLPIEFQTHRGRAIFYPTYFDRLSLEIINPHNRKKRAGTNPIHYEVVPPGTEGILQIIYIPFDGVLESENELRKQIGKDLANLCKAIEKLQKRGIGAKTKLGWGRFKLSEKKVCLNSDLRIPKGWKRC